MTKEITEKEFQIKMLESINEFTEALARNKLYFETYLDVKNAGHSLVFYENDDGDIYYVLLTQPLANHEDETMMVV